MNRIQVGGPGVVTGPRRRPRLSEQVLTRRVTWRDLTFWSLWGLLFTIPMLKAVTLSSVGTLSRVVGLAVMVVALPSILLNGRRRRLLDVHILAIAFTVWVMGSYFWSINSSETVDKAFTMVQLLVMVLCLWEFVTTREQYLSLLRAFCLGASVGCGSLIWGVLSGTGGELQRYSLAEAGPNAVAFTLCLAMPIAWYLSFEARSSQAVLLWRCYVPFALIGVLLTASRAALLIGVLAMVFIPLSLNRLTRTAKVWLVVTSALFVLVGSFLIPAGPAERLSTVSSEIESGDFNGRAKLWAAGVELFGQEPITGMGAGAARFRVERITGELEGVHNTYLSLAADVGVIGLGLFLLILYVIAHRALTTEGLDRKFAIVLLLTLVVGLIPRHWEFEKGTWVTIALLATLGAAGVASRGQDPTRTEASPQILE